MKAKVFYNSSNPGEIPGAGYKKNTIVCSKRLFIAVTLPEKIRMQLFETINGFSAKNSLIRPVAPENIHLTLKFLGQTDIFLLPQIITAIRITAESFERFNMVIDNTIDSFPNLLSARILHVSLKDPAGQIREVFKTLEENLEKIKIAKDERKFVPHITLARIKDRIDAEDLVKKVHFNLKEKIAFNKITLFESRLRQSSPEYIILEEFELK